MFALFKNEKQVSKAYDRKNQVMLMVVMLERQALNEDNEFVDGYKIKKLPSAVILQFNTKR